MKQEKCTTVMLTQIRRIVLASVAKQSGKIPGLLRYARKDVNIKLT